MDLLLSEPQSLFAETAARLAADRGGPKRLRALRAAGAEMDAEAWHRMVEAGWLAIAVAERHGGPGLGLFDLALALEQAGRSLLRVPLLETAAAAWTMSRAEDCSRAGAGLADLLRGSRLIVPATEAASWRHGGGSPGIRYDHRVGVLDGSVAFVAYGETADAFLVAIDSGAQPVLAVVAREDIGVSTQRNVDGSTSSTLSFAAVHVSAERVIATGAEARRLALQLQEFLMLGAAVELVGLAAAALAVTLEHIKLRQQFGRPIGSFQVLQHRAVDGFIDIELDRSLAYRVIAAWDAGEHHPAMVAATKARASRSALQVTRAALQMHGAIGYTEEHDIGLYYKRAMVLAARYGGELVQTGAFSALTAAPGASP
ncbi:MAG TPA: acyl-CoA dehydrogenase family protein [Xanthobacteraceae bacterium]